MSCNQKIFGYSLDEIIHSFDDFNKHFVLGQVLLSGGQGSIYATAAKQSASILTNTSRTCKNHNSMSWKLITKCVKLQQEQQQEQEQEQHASETKLKCVQEYILQRKLNMIHYNGISYNQNQDTILLTMEMLQYSLSDAIDLNIDEHVHDFQCIKSDYGLKYFILEVSSFLHQLHTLGFVHLDIKPDNIMFRNQKNEESLMYGNGWKVIDLGLTERINNKNKIKCNVVSIDSFVGTIGYAAPEIDPLTDSESLSQVSCKADIWSLGVVILYIINGYNIFDINTKTTDDDDDDVEGQNKYMEYKEKLRTTDWIHSHLMDLYLNSKINFNLYDLLSQCLECNVNKRLSARDILQHPLFTGIVFQNKADSELYCYRNRSRIITKPKSSHNIDTDIDIAPFVPLTKKIRI